MPVDVRRVAVLGFSDFERDALASCLRLAGGAAARHRYAAIDALATADLAIVDAASAAALHDAAHAGLMPSTLVIGEAAPRNAGARLARPIEPARVLGALDALAAHAGGSDEAAARCALVVDDSAVARRFLQQRLAAWGWRCDEAVDSDEALARLRHAPPVTLVFVDVELGPASALDGLALCRLIRHGPPAPNDGPGAGAARVASAAPAQPSAHVDRRAAAGSAPSLAPAVIAARPRASPPSVPIPPPPPVVIVSAHGGEEDRVRGVLAGCSDYLVKPLDDARLLEVLRQHGRWPGPVGGAR